MESNLLRTSASTNTTKKMELAWDEEITELHCQAGADMDT